MSGDTQPKKRKDKKRKKDDEDMVKETTVHAPKQQSAGAAQAAKDPSDVQMHIHSDHGTGGHWCAKVVFFILLAGLGALIGLIIMENQGVSNEDTPLSESRYSEFFNGWVDETRQDDHHHEEILAAINSLDDHDDHDNGGAEHAVDDHDDDDEHGGEDDDHDDGAPYAEVEDHDDDDDGAQGQDEDDDDEGPAQKLEDDEVEEIFAQQEAAARQEAFAQAQDDDDDEQDDDGDGDDDDDDDNGANDQSNVANNNDDDDDDANDDDDEHFDLKQSEETNNNDQKDDDDDDDDDDNENNDDDDDNDDDAENIAREIEEIAQADDDQDDTPFDEEREATAEPPSVMPVTGETLKNQMDELVRNYNKLAQSLDVPLVEETLDEPEIKEDTVKGSQLRKDEDDDGDEDEIEEVKRGSEQPNAADDDDDDDDDADDDGNEGGFDEFVDNDGGEEEYLAKLRSEQQRRTAAEEERKSAVEPEEETSLTVKIFVGVALLGAAHLLLTSPRAPTKKSPNDNSKVGTNNGSGSSASPSSQKREEEATTQTSSSASNKSVANDFIYAGPVEQLSNDNADVIEGNVIRYDEQGDPERYSGDEYDYEMEELDEELEEVEAEEDEEEKHLIKQEQEIGAFVPITFEDFNSMYRPPPELAELVVEQQQYDVQPEAHPPTEPHLTKKGPKESPLTSKKPPKGAVNKLIYGLHKDPIVIPTEEGGDPATMETAGANVSAKGEAKSVLTALLSEIPSPPIDLDHEFDKLVPTEATSARSTTESGSFQRPALGRNESTPAREKHVEFLLPEREPEFELEPEPLSERMANWSVPVDNGSKENLFIPDASEEEMEPDEYGEDYGQYEGEEEEDMVYEDDEELDDIESVLLNQYGSDEEEEPLTDDNIPPGGEDEEASDVDDSDLMRRLEQKYGKLPAASSSSSTANTTEATSPDDDEDEAAAAGWTKIPTRAEEADRSYQEELRRAQQQLDENQAQPALEAFERIIARKSNSIAALVGRARALDALAEQRRSNSILTDAIAAYRKVIVQDLVVDDGTLKAVADRCIDRLRFQGQHAKAIEIHEILIRRFDDEPHYRNQLAVTYLYMNRLPEAKAILHETLLRWIDDGFALVHYGFVLKTHDNNMELGAQYLREGIDTGHEGTQDGRFYFQLGDALQRLGRNAEALDIYRRGVEKKLFLSLYQRSLYNVVGLRSRPFWTVEQTTYATDLERVRSQWTLIRDEGLKLLNADGVFVNESENLRDRGDWKQFELFSRGSRLERNCARAPLTCRLIEQHLPAARSCKRGQVKFSVMLPGTHVWPHCGPTNCRIRAHLGLNVPDGTHIRVAEKTRSWENGKWLIFDDSFEHEVWHNGTTTRLVLIIDLWHPDLTESQRRSLSPI
ncbi:probable serine/threonine-protein kinase kinX [Anopheles ziemanni]|uniref:probable serine/threonine-protein kinase kinX n=1 Tax=Anopheles ziemanni TaxID=345580 RepID=UPI00265E3EA5|nr:probable serine/threonine-protein kinase kinX [Anopheles ziemanni]